jgi:hypothetical protein
VLGMLKHAQIFDISVGQPYKYDSSFGTKKGINFACISSSDGSLLFPKILVADWSFLI